MSCYWSSSSPTGGVEFSSFFPFYLLQFNACHSRGSSHGQSRTTRRAYEKPYYVQMMNDAYTLWSDLERESGVPLYKYVQ